MSGDHSTLWKFTKWAAVAAYLLVPVMTGWLSSSRIECSYCLGENLRHALAFFGYFLLGGFALSYTQPRRPSSDSAEVQRRPAISYREDLQEVWFWVSLGMASWFFMVGFNWKLFFL